MTRRRAILAASLAALACAVYAACNPRVEPPECDSYVEESCGGTEPRDLPPSVGWEAVDSHGNSFSGTGSEAVFDRGSNVCSATCTFTLTVSPTKCSPPEPVVKTGTAVFENAVTVTCQGPHVSTNGPRVCTTSARHPDHVFRTEAECLPNLVEKVEPPHAFAKSNVFDENVAVQAYKQREEPQKLSKIGLSHR